MIQDQIRSLAKTPNPITPESLPAEQIYILHDTFSWIERLYRRDKNLPYPPTHPEPYEIPPEIDRRLELSCKLLPIEVFKQRNILFLKSMKLFDPDRTKLFDALATALEPPRYSHLWPKPALEDDCPPPHQKTNRQVEPGQAITPRPIVHHPQKKLSRGLRWRTDLRWDRLTPCAIKVFIVLCLRAKWPKGLESFPFAWGGVGTWTKEEGIKLGSLCRLTGYGQRQVRYALCQLQGLSMIKKINRGYEGHGVSKFFVFFTPEMSTAYTAIAKNKIRRPSSKKQNSRMS